MSSKPEYATSDQLIIQTLLLMQHHPIRVDVNGQTLSYVFDKEEIQVDLSRILTNDLENLKFSIQQFWAMQNVWVINLRHATGTRR